MVCTRVQAGLYIFTLFDWYAGGLNVLVIALCEVIGIAWIYGLNTKMYTSNCIMNCHHYICDYDATAFDGAE